MMSMTTGWLERHRRQGFDELVAELADFSHDGLVTLHADLRADRVIRGSWAGCVLSYRRGGPGSARRDRRGRPRNAFTELWDEGRLTDQEVRAAVAGELARRGLDPEAVGPHYALRRTPVRT